MRSESINIHHQHVNTTPPSEIAHRSSPTSLPTARRESISRPCAVPRTHRDETAPQKQPTQPSPGPALNRPGTAPASPETLMVTQFRGVGIFESVGVLTRKGGVSCHIDIHQSSVARSWTCRLPAGRWRPQQVIVVCRTRPSTTGDAKTLWTGGCRAGSHHQQSRGTYGALCCPIRAGSGRGSPRVRIRLIWLKASTRCSDGWGEPPGGGGLIVWRGCWLWAPTLSDPRLSEWPGTTG